MPDTYPGKVERTMLPETLKELSIKVSQYFLDFLESDFKRQQAPRRRAKAANVTANLTYPQM